MLGEICVEKFGLDRFALADALSEHWEEMQHGRIPPTDDGAPRVKTRSAEARELRALFEEADAERARFAAKTDELERRLVLLEPIVADISQVLVEPGSSRG